MLRFSELLAAEGVVHKLLDEEVVIELPGGCGVLVYRVVGDDDVLCLVDDPWHTHSAVEGGLAGLAALAMRLTEGRDCLLIRERTAGEAERRVIHLGSIEKYLRYLPEKTTYVVCSA